MALVDPDQFTDKEVACIYIAARRSEAKRVEDALSANGIDYVVDIEPFETTFLGVFRSKRDGVGFYVLVDQADLSRRVLHAARLLQGLVDPVQE